MKILFAGVEKMDSIFFILITMLYNIHIATSTCNKNDLLLEPKKANGTNNTSCCF